MKYGRLRLLIIGTFVMLVLPGLANNTGYAKQPACQTFVETGMSVCDRFLTYWQEHGGLAQQGFPISNEMQEVSETNGQTYTTQYFERAVFEYHPEETPEYQVLLSLLGVFYYNQKYPNGAPGQTTNNSSGSILFNETGKRLGGVFLDYWQSHGGLAQQGFPISDEFTEVSDLNGQSYKVQYFERAVFEYHPEETQPEYRVLLSQLGTFRYQSKYLQPLSPTALPTSATNPTQPVTVPPGTPSAVPTSASQPTVAPTVTLDCSDIPPDEGMVVTYKCLHVGDYTDFRASGFTPGETVTLCTVNPGSQACLIPISDIANADGNVLICCFNAFRSDRAGLYMSRMLGEQSGHTATGYFMLIK